MISASAPLKTLTLPLLILLVLKGDLLLSERGVDSLSVAPLRTTTAEQYY